MVVCNLVVLRVGNPHDLEFDSNLQFSIVDYVIDPLTLFRVLDQQQYWTSTGQNCSTQQEDMELK